jgi:hypothetical protein
LSLVAAVVLGLIMLLKVLEVVVRVDTENFPHNL